MVTNYHLEKKSPKCPCGLDGSSYKCVTANTRQDTSKTFKQPLSNILLRPRKVNVLAFFFFTLNNCLDWKMHNATVFQMRFLLYFLMECPLRWTGFFFLSKAVKPLSPTEDRTALLGLGRICAPSTSGYKILKRNTPFISDSVQVKCVTTKEMPCTCSDLHGRRPH